MNLFGRRPSSKPPASKDPAQIIMKLRGTVETLEKRQVHLDKQVTKQISDAKAKMAKKDKRGALFCLKRKKMYEAEIEKINGARLTLEQQIIALEGTVTNADTVGAMKAGATAMKHARQDVDADAVGDLMDDIQEEMATADEISAAISAPAGDLLGDDELLDELNELEEHELEAQLLDAPPIPVAPLPDRMPAAPTRLPAAPKQEDADLAALRELEAAMAM
jgi:charged multivesicular body protein 4